MPVMNERGMKERGCGSKQKQRTLGALISACGPMAIAKPDMEHGLWAWMEIGKGWRVIRPRLQEPRKASRCMRARSHF